MKGKRIQFIDTGRSFGGAERVTLALASAFLAEGADVECLVDRHAFPFVEELSGAGIPARAVDETDRPGRIGALGAEVRRFDPHIVHLQRTWPLSDRYASIAVRRASKARFVATEHVRFEGCGLRDRLAKGILCRFDHRLVAVSRAVGESLERFWKVPASKIAVIPNGIDVGRFRRGGGEGRRGGLFPERCTFRIGAVGRLE